MGPAPWGAPPSGDGRSPQRPWGRVVAYATTPESCQGQRAKRALTRFVPGGVPPDKGHGASPQAPWGACCGVRHNTRILSRPESEACLDEIRSGGGVPPDRREMVRPAPGAPRSGDGASPQAPWGACCGIRHNTRILSRPESEACLDEIRSGGACPPDKTAALLSGRGGPAPRPGPPDTQSQDLVTRRLVEEVQSGGIDPEAHHVAAKYNQRALHSCTQPVGPGPSMHQQVRSNILNLIHAHLDDPFTACPPAQVLRTYPQHTPLDADGAWQLD